MKNKRSVIYYLFSLAAVISASFYPIYMGVTVISDMLTYGSVSAEDYPKYIIPYTPVAVAVIIGVLLLPILFKLSKRFSLWAGSAVSVSVFFIAELLLENTVLVSRTFTEHVPTEHTLEDWQMYMCYIPPAATEERTWTEVNVLMGEYSPAFKLHFYIISVVLVITILNAVYGFAGVIIENNKARLKPLIMQSASTLMFLGMCIWACFTAFYRNGEITVSPLSAVLMCTFFIIFGLTVGVFVSSFTFSKRPVLSVTLPAVMSALTAFVMYIGEMILLSGNLYRFGSGWFFEKIPFVVLAPIDICVIIISALASALLANCVREKLRKEP